MPKRYCVQCGRALSSYNKSDRCFCHQSKVSKMMPKRRTQRESVRLAKLADILNIKKDCRCQEEKAMHIETIFDHIFYNADPKDVKEFAEKIIANRKPKFSDFPCTQGGYK